MTDTRPITNYQTLYDYMEKNNMVTINETPHGRFALTKNDTIIKTYSRRRDAVRGADRLGYVL